MKNGEQPAFSPNRKKISSDENMKQGGYGLTKREYFAAMLMQGILANPDSIIVKLKDSEKIQYSLICADELLKQLENS